MATPFLKPRYRGARFNGKRMPVDVLRDLDLFQNLILQTARWLYLKDNPERKRLPRGWNGFRLLLAGIEDGSAVPVLEIEDEQAPEGAMEYYGRARDLMISDVAAAASGENPRLELPANLLDFFHRIGRGLRPDEELLIETPDRNRSGLLNRQSRRILASAGRNKSYEEFVELVGVMPELDKQHRTYTFLTAAGERIPGAYEPWLDDEMKAAHEAYETQVPHLLSANGLFRPGMDLEKILETLDIEEQYNFSELPGFLELSKLAPGWYDGEQGDIPSPEDLQWFFNQYMTRAKWSGAVADPVFCLTVDGSLRAEWLAKPWDVSLEIDLPSKTGYFHSLNLATDEDSEIEGLDLATVEAWNQIETAIRETVGKVAHD